MKLFCIGKIRRKKVRETNILREARPKKVGLIYSKYWPFFVFSFIIFFLFFLSLQAYYSQGMGLAASGTASANMGNGNMANNGAALPPFLPMAAQLSQYSAAASAAASAVAGAGTYSQGSVGVPPGSTAASAGEYRRPLSVLF